MRLRITMLAVAAAAITSAAVPATAAAAPHPNRGLTIHAVPHSIMAGDPVLIYGRLRGPNDSNRLIRLFHRINPRPFFSLIQTTRTDSAGRYEFLRLRGIVDTNRSWFVRGPGSSQSPTVHERVQALVTLAASALQGPTRHQIAFSGHVTPSHTGERVLLQVQRGSSDNWTTVDSGRLGPQSNYLIQHGWRTPGERNVRTVFAGGPRNTRAASDPVMVAIQQAQVPDLTISTNDPIVPNGAQAVISGVLYHQGTTNPDSGTPVQLFGRMPGHGPARVLQSTTTGPDGSYSFHVATTTNELYQVRSEAAPARSSAVLFEGVQDVVTMSVSSQTSIVGGHVTFSGDVSPGKPGHVIYLQKLGRDNNWHTVGVRRVAVNSTFQFGWTFATQGQKVFRARITGGPVNVGGVSTPPVTVAVSQPPLSALPTG